jgi:mannose-6-phosphate isomerase-like protein (cupin superfamily)
MESFYELNDILSTIDTDEYFTDFLNTKNLEAGIIRLREGQIDTQTNHPLDELYYVIKGEGNIKMDGKAHVVSSGTMVFVPANTDHHFFGNKDELLVLYVFPKHK